MLPRGKYRLNRFTRRWVMGGWWVGARSVGVGGKLRALPSWLRSSTVAICASIAL